MTDNSPSSITRGQLCSTLLPIATKRLESLPGLIQEQLELLRDQKDETDDEVRFVQLDDTQMRISRLKEEQAVLRSLIKRFSQKPEVSMPGFVPGGFYRVQLDDGVEDEEMIVGVSDFGCPTEISSRLSKELGKPVMIISYHGCEANKAMIDNDIPAVPGTEVRIVPKKGYGVTWQVLDVISDAPRG